VQVVDSTSFSPPLDEVVRRLQRVFVRSLSTVSTPKDDHVKLSAVRDVRVAVLSFIATVVATCFHGPTASGQQVVSPITDAGAAAKAAGVPPGTQKMAEFLEVCAKAADAETCIALNVERVAIFRKRLERAMGTPRESELRIKLAIELVQSGLPEEALAELDRAEAALKKRDGTPDRHSQWQIDRTRSLCWMRIGEIDNCLARHCCSSCIAPIEGGGAHADKRGSENAIPILMRMLERDPEDGESRWLLNLAHMTLGTWPDGVPEGQLIPRERFASEYELPRFKDVAADCGVAIPTISGGIVTEDFDKDGFIDLMVTSIGFHDQMRYFHANGDGTFTDRTAEAGLTGLVGGLNMTHADFDNDGWTDVLVLRGAWMDESGQIPDSLLRNRGDGTFEDVTDAAGMVTYHPSQTGSFADFNLDGWLDIVIGNETQHDENPHPCELWINQKDGTFKNVAEAVNADLTAFVKAVAVGDYDDDGRPDVYYSRRGQTNILMHNVPDDTPGGAGFKFVDVSRQANVLMPNMSFPCWWFDYDNDGRLDLYVATNSGFTQKNTDGIGEFVAGKTISLEMPRLYHNEGNGKFIDVAPKIGLARSILSMGSNYGDFDNDGWLDMYLGNGAPSLAALLPNKAFRNDRGKAFQDVTTALGVGHLQKGHGVAFADLDNDGDQDVFIELGGFYSADVYPSSLFENPGGNSNHWVTLRLEGVKANKSGIGARIRVDVASPSGDRSMHLVCGTGGSFGSSTLQQEIGLGDATAIKQIHIRWPGSDTRQTIAGEGVALDRFYRIVEGKDVLEPVAVKKIQLGKKPDVPAGG